MHLFAIGSSLRLFLSKNQEWMKKTSTSEHCRDSIVDSPCIIRWSLPTVHGITHFHRRDDQFGHRGAFLIFTLLRSLACGSRQFHKRSYRFLSHISTLQHLCTIFSCLPRTLSHRLHFLAVDSQWPLGGWGGVFYLISLTHSIVVDAVTMQHCDSQEHRMKIYTRIEGRERHKRIMHEQREISL